MEIESQHFDNIQCEENLKKLPEFLEMLSNTFHIINARKESLH